MPVSKKVSLLAASMTICAVVAGSFGASADDPNASTKLTRGQIRDMVDEMLDDASASSNATTISNLIESYRTTSGNSSQNSANLLIQDAPIIGFAASTVLPGEWQTVYDDQWNANLKSVVSDATLDSVFDLFIQSVADGSSTEPAAGEIGSCLAKKVQEGEWTTDDNGNKTKCQVDDQDANFDAPGVLTMLWVKMNCVLPFMSACGVRQKVFAAAKETIYHTIHDKDANGQSPLFHEFENEFPGQFRTGLLQMGNGLRAGIANLITQKLKANLDPLWANGDTVETEDNDSPRITFKGLAKGLSADMKAAALFSASDDPALRGRAGTLLYAAANKLVLIMGGQAAIWDPTRARVAADGSDAMGAFLLNGPNGTDPGVDPAHPKAVPIFDTTPFGGIGMTAAGVHQNDPMQAWDLSAYTAAGAVPAPGTKAPPAVAFQIFPAEFSLQNGVASVTSPASGTERLEDLDEMALSLEKFLTLTRPGGALSEYFGHVENLTDDILSPTNTMTYPVEGRQLAVGLLAAILKNLVDPMNGHVSENAVDANGHTVVDSKGNPVSLAPGADRGGAGLAFFEAVGLEGRLPETTRVSTVAKTLSAATGLRDIILSDDPEVPAALTAYHSEIDQAVQVMALTLVAKQCRAPDGGFYEFVNHPTLAPRSLVTQIEAIRALTLVYQQTKTLALLQALAQAWQFMDGYWVVGNVIPKTSDVAVPGEEYFQPSELWNLNRLWGEVTASASFADIPAKIPGWQNEWAKWKTRFDQLKGNLTSDLDPSAPQPERIKAP